MRLMLQWGRSVMVHPSGRTSVVIEDIHGSRSERGTEPSTYATVSVQPLADGRSVFFWMSSKMSLVDASWVSIRVIYLSPPATRRP